MPTSPPRAAIPSVDRLLRHPRVERLTTAHGRVAVTGCVRDALAELRASLIASADGAGEPRDDLEGRAVTMVGERIERLFAPTLQPVFNLTGTVLHTNLGRAPLPQEAIDAIAAVARGASNLEFDLGSGRRGDRDSLVEDWLVRITGAEAATVVNNNAAAVLLTLNSLALRKEVAVSRGELVEIGGAFRIPDIMSRAGARLVEVGTTNRTHARDFEGAIGPRTALLMSIHTSNYEIKGFTASVPEKRLAEIAHAHDVPFVVDLGSGTLIDLERFGLPHEPTPMEALAAGADLVTFSGDKLLGGPQCGIVVGRTDLVARLKKNPMKRAMRCDKLTLAALDAVLRLYADPARIAERVPTVRLLARGQADIRAAAEALRPALQEALGDAVTVTVVDCASQVGSGALPVDSLPSAAVSVAVSAAGSGRSRGGRRLAAIASALRRLPVPVIGRISDDRLIFDCRCLESVPDLTRVLTHLDRAEI